MVLPTLPVIQTILANVFSLVTFAKTFKDLKVFSVFIILCLGNFFIFLLITDLIAPFFIACPTNLCPSTCFPFNGKIFG